MSATYVDSLPTDRDKVRSDLGGGVTILPTSDPLLTDEHIVAVLALLGTRELAVAYLARELIVRFAGKPVKLKIGDLHLDYSARLTEWERLAGRAGGLTFIAASYGSADALDEYARV